MEEKNRWWWNEAEKVAVLRKKYARKPMYRNSTGIIRGGTKARRIKQRKLFQSNEREG